MKQVPCPCCPAIFDRSYSRLSPIYGSYLMERANPLLALAFAALLCANPCLAAPSMCQRTSFIGEVKAQDSFRADIGLGLTFRVEPSGDESGWQFEIGPTRAQPDEWDAYIYTLTPPWRGRHTTMLDTSYATPAQEAVGTRSHDFWFLLRQSDAAKAKAALDDVLWPKTDDAQDKALKRLGEFPMGTGELTVLGADIEPASAASGSSSEPESFGHVHRISFRVALTLPESFVPARTVSKETVPCPDPRAWARQWEP